MATVPLPPTSGSIALNGSGNGTVQLGPYFSHERWYPSTVSFSVATNTNEAQCKIYVGPSADQAHYVDGSLSGSTGDATSKVNGYTVGQGVYLWAVWTGGDAGSLATLQVQGTKSTGGGPNEPPSIGGTEGCSNPIVGGGGALVYPSIHSPNFNQSPLTGWSIDKNGNAFFGSITLPPGAGGATVFVQGTTPTANNVNDVWINTSNNNEILTWNGTSWVAQQLGTNAIASGSITAALIAANTIVSSNIASGAIVAGLIAAGAIDGQTINGVTINGATINATTNGVFAYIGAGSALNLNPNFSTGITNWTAVDGGISYTTPVYSGHDTMAIALTTSNPNGLLGIAQSEFEAVTAGTSYFCDFIVQSSGMGVNPKSFISVEIDWYDSSSNFLGESTVANPPINQGSWIEYSGVVTAITGATKMKVTIRANSVSSGAVVNVAMASIATDPQLLASFAPKAGTDIYGNSYNAGIWAYNGSGSAMGIDVISTIPLVDFSPQGRTHNTLDPEIFAAVNNAGAANEVTYLVISSGKEGHDDAALQLFSESADATIPAEAIFEFGGSIAFTFTKTLLSMGIPISWAAQSTPAASAGNAVTFSDNNGALAYVDGQDTEVYKTGRRTLYLTSQTGNVTGSWTVFANGSTIFSTTVGLVSGTRVYRIHGVIYAVATANAEFAMGIGAPAGSNGSFYYFGLRAAVDEGAVQGGVNTIVGDTTVLGTATYPFNFDGIVTITTGGTLSVVCGSLVATTFAVGAYSFVDIEPL